MTTHRKLAPYLMTGANQSMWIDDSPGARSKYPCWGIEFCPVCDNLGGYHGPCLSCARMKEVYPTVLGAEEDNHPTNIDTCEVDLSDYLE